MFRSYIRGELLLLVERSNEGTKWEKQRELRPLNASLASFVILTKENGKWRILKLEMEMFMSEIHISLLNFSEIQQRKPLKQFPKASKRAGVTKLIVRLDVRLLGGQVLARTGGVHYGDRKDGDEPEACRQGLGRVHVR